MAKKENIRVDVKPIKNKAIKKGFQTELDIKDILPEAQYVLKNEGCVYGLFNNSSLVGIYVLSLEDDYFRARNIALKKRERTDNKSVLRLIHRIFAPEIKELLPELEKKILMDLKGKIYVGTIAGIEWRTRLLYKQVVPGKGKIYGLGFLFGFLVGIILGRILFKDWLITLGISLIFGIFGLLCAAALIHEKSIGSVKLSKYV